MLLHHILSRALLLPHALTPEPTADSQRFRSRDPQVVDSAGQASGPLLLKLFGADDGHLAHVISTSRLALAVPTALLIALYAARLLWMRAEERAVGASNAMV